jgi:hypothetical protein
LDAQAPLALIRVSRLQLDRLGAPDSLTLVLIVAGIGRAVSADLARFGWKLVELGNGYSRIAGCPYPAFILDIDAVATAEHDDLLGSFGHHKMETVQATKWWREHVMRTNPTELATLEGYDDMLRKFLDALAPEERLAGLAPEERLAGLAPEDRLAGLAPEERLAGLAPEELEMLEAAIRRRLRGEG